MTGIHLPEGHPPPPKRKEEKHPSDLKIDELEQNNLVGYLHSHKGPEKSPTAAYKYITTEKIIYGFISQCAISRNKQHDDLLQI